MKRAKRPEGVDYMTFIIARESYLESKAHSDKTYSELQETFEYQPYRLHCNVPKNAKREVLVAELKRIDIIASESDTELTNTNEVLQMATNQDDTYVYELNSKSYRQLQALGKELRAQGFYKGALNVSKSELVVGLAAAQRKLNAQLQERNERSVRGNQSPRLQAGTRANLMAGSKARQARENAPTTSKEYVALNKSFNKCAQELQSLGTPAPQAAKATFAYKQMKHSNAYMCNGASV